MTSARCSRPWRCPTRTVPGGSCGPRSVVRRAGPDGTDLTVRAIRLWLHEYGAATIETDPAWVVELLIGLITLSDADDGPAWLERVRQAHPRGRRRARRADRDGVRRAPPATGAAAAGHRPPARRRGSDRRHPAGPRPLRTSTLDRKRTPPGRASSRGARRDRASTRPPGRQPGRRQGSWPGHRRPRRGRRRRAHPRPSSSPRTRRPRRRRARPGQPRTRAHLRRPGTGRSPSRAPRPRTPRRESSTDHAGRRGQSSPDAAQPDHVAPGQAGPHARRRGRRRSAARPGPALLHRARRGRPPDVRRGGRRPGAAVRPVKAQRR